MNHDAIYALYTSVVTINDSGAFDANGNEVVISLPLVDDWVDPMAYVRLREAAYPPLTDYLDAIVKGDTVQAQAYIDACLAVKAEYPK